MEYLLIYQVFFIDSFIFFILAGLVLHTGAEFSWCFYSRGPINGRLTEDTVCVSLCWTPGSTRPHKASLCSMGRLSVRHFSCSSPSLILSSSFRCSMMSADFILTKCS